MAARPYHISCCAHQAISYTMPCIARPCNIPCYASPDHTLYHIMATRPYHMPCQAHKAIPYTMPWPLDYTMYHCQAIPYTMPCPQGHIFSHAMPARPYNIPCHASSVHNIYHAMTTRPYHIPYHACQVIPYTIYHAMPRPTTTSVNHVT